MHGLFPIPNPIPDKVKFARSVTPDLIEAANRASKATTTPQMTDALRSVRYWLEWAEKAIAPSDRQVPLPPPPPMAREVHEDQRPSL